MIDPKTTIWRSSPDGMILVKEIKGIITPEPKQGQTVYIPNLGDTICTGITSSGSENTVIEVQLSIKNLQE
ncbi:MAG: hypothetical protein JXB48_01030 [Candidatus Latescibacteria bacterium]|nr:hypothetical protein [Candidatus Latescibacterota bacterium]